MASLTQWTGVWASSRSWWWTGKPGMLQSMALQRVRHDWATELNWTRSSWDPHYTSQTLYSSEKINVRCCMHLQRVLFGVYTAVLQPKSPWFGLLLSSSNFKWRIRALVWMFHVSSCQDSQTNKKMRNYTIWPSYFHEALRGIQAN